VKEQQNQITNLEKEIEALKIKEKKQANSLKKY
jgi:hypothetical protein